MEWQRAHISRTKYKGERFASRKVAKMLKLYKNKKGEKLYPVCSWNANQHKLYNAHDRVMNLIDDLHEEIAFTHEAIKQEALDRAYEKQEEIEHVIDVFSAYVVDGVVYATWNDRNLIKDYIAAYDVRHDMEGTWRN